MENNTQNILKNLIKYGHTFIHDSKRNLYIFFDKNELKDSISNIKKCFNGNPNDKIEGSNCTNGEALKRIDTLDKIVDFLTTNPNNIDIFDYLPYTKDGKFSKSGAISLFCPDIKNTWSGDYFAQYEVVLELEAYKNHTYDLESNEIAVMTVTMKSLCDKKSPKNVIDENCNFIPLVKTKRNSYLKQSDLVPGTSYTDAKGSEYLYIGGMSDSKHITPSYIKVTKKIKNDLAKFTTLYDYLYHRFTENIKCKYNHGYYDTDPFNRVMSSFSRKFIEPNTIYFDQNHNHLSKMKISMLRFYDDSLKKADESKNYFHYTLTFGTDFKK